MNKDLYVGLDIGTNSIGWAVTDEEYNLMRLRGKTAWGSRIFSSAESKKTTRLLRENRRRLKRRRYRISLLQELFAVEIAKIDSTFFLRLDNASYLLEDKVAERVKNKLIFKDKPNQNIGKNLIFKKKEEEVQYYKNYPTIWHLRKKLIEGDKETLFNLKYVYLALHHMMKYRGNFLTEGNLSYQKINKDTIDNINAFFQKKLPDEEKIIFLSEDKANDLQTILLNENMKKTEKRKKISELFNTDGMTDEIASFIQLFSTLVCKGKYRLSSLGESYKESDLSIVFDDSHEQLSEQIESLLQDDFLIVQLAKQIADSVSLKELMGDEEYFSFAMVNIYEQHKNDLKLLKQVIQHIDQNNTNKKERLYDIVFKKKMGVDSKNKEVSLNNYSDLVHVNSIQDKRASLESFNTFIEKVLKENASFIQDDYQEKYQDLLNKAEKKKLLTIIAHVSTSIVPHQLHLNELKIIIDNAAEFHPFLTDIKEKLISLFTFRVPYYYGPLNDQSEFSYVERNNNTTITPWNINDVIDDSNTRKKFINKLVNQCSYIHSEKVLAKASLSFESYLILDKLNVMMVNGNYLTPKEKEDLYQHILSRSKTTLNQIKKYLIANYSPDKKEKDIIISNIKDDTIFEASSHAHLSAQFDIDTESNKLEYLIYLATIYADDKKELKGLLQDKKQFNLSEEQIKCILTLQTKKWSPLSYKLLNEIYYEDSSTGVQVSILQAMRETNLNFQGVLNSDIYRFKDLITQYNLSIQGQKSVDELIEERLEKVPSIVQRSITQTLLILEDIQKASKRKFDKIFIEVTREDDEQKKNKETDSREKEIQNFIKSIESDCDSIKNSDLASLHEDFENLSEERRIKLKSKAIYLYFKQMGLDLYTGKKIKLEDVINGNKYDLDHIIPRSLIKDDSLDNLVLVEKYVNEKLKGDTYPLPQIIKDDKEVIKLWKYLFQKKAISEKKYANLMRNSDLSYEEIADFVSRQINVINYSNIVIRDILKLKYPETELVFSKAHYPAFTRNFLQIVKNRDLNDAHHAVDAYLNVFCGNVLSTTFQNVRNLYNQKVEDKQKTKTFNMEKVLERQLNHYDSTNICYADKIRKNCFRHDALVTFKCDYNNGAFYGATLNAKTALTNPVPIHTGKNNPMIDVKKYGGYSGLAQAYLLAVEIKAKKKTKKKILRISVLDDQRFHGDLQKIVQTVIPDQKDCTIKVLRKINLNQKIRYDQGIYLIYSNSESKNKYKMAYQNYLDNDYLLYLQQASKVYEQIDTSLDYQEFVKNLKNDKIIVSKEKNLEIFMQLLANANKKVYDTTTYIVKLRTIQKDNFISSDMKEQLDILKNMILCLSRNNENCKFKKDLLKDDISNFMMIITNNITKQNITLIYESPTGLFSHEVKI